MREATCPVTSEQIIDVAVCQCCTVGRAFLCPVKQEVEVAEAYRR